MKELPTKGYVWCTEQDFGEEGNIYMTVDAANTAISENLSVSDYMEEVGYETIDDLKDEGLLYLGTVKIVW